MNNPSIRVPFQRLILCGAVFLSAILPAHAAEDQVFADFESDSYGGWQAVGNAFGSSPAQGTLPGQMQVSGFQGKSLVNSFTGGDAGTGTLTSPEFVIQHAYIRFLIGGGGFDGMTCINLLVDGKPVRSTTGPNTQPGGSEELAPASWEVRDLIGRSARIQIVDQATGGWGHVNVDQIVLTDRKPPGLTLNARREIATQSRYLQFPVKTGAKSRRLAVLVDDKIVREFDIELAEDAEDWWAPLDVSQWRGKTATLRVDRLPEDSRALAKVDQSDAIRGKDPLYQEPLRPQIHFSPRRGWNNDPNGMVYSQGEYHLYYQNNPYGWNWGNMHWAHAVSRDLVHWQEQPIAIYPREYGDAVFSGSAVVDRNNTSGWKSGKDDLLVAAFTSTGRGECIVYSNDRGRTWSEFSGNPVVKHQGRDPRLFWHAPTSKWVMALYDEYNKGQYIAFYTSPDLKAWKFESRIEGFYECPDIFPLPVDGDAKKTKWVLTAASSEYRVGSFDGATFVPETPKLPGHRGEAFYAAQTFSDTPDGRRIQIGWGQMATPGMPFNQMMCFPCELKLKGSSDGPRLTWQPVHELSLLRKSSHRFSSQPLGAGLPDPFARIEPGPLDLEIEFDPGTASEVGFTLLGQPVVYEVAKHELAVGKHHASVPMEKGRVKIQVLCDRTSLEVFAADGLVYMPSRVPLKHEGPAAASHAIGGQAKLTRLVVHDLQSIWGNRNR